MKKLLLGCGALFGLLVVAVVGAIVWLGLQIESGAIPDTTVVAGNKLSQAARDAIANAITLGPDEKVMYFYSASMLDWQEDGNLVTNERVVSYSQGEHDLEVSQADFDQIEELAPSFSDEWAEDSVVNISTKDGDWFVIWLSSENELDHAAVEYIQQQMKKSAEQQPAEEESAEEESAEEEPAEGEQAEEQQDASRP